MKTPRYFRLVPLLVVALLLALRAGAFPIITNVVETGGDNEATDTVTAKWTGVTYVGGIANEPVPGLAAGASYTVGLFGSYAPCFVDRNHRWTNAVPAALPPYLAGQEYIMSGNDNRDNASYTLDVSVATAVNVYMLIDNRLSDGDGNTPPTFGAANMQWILDEGWTPVTNGFNRAANPALPDEVAVDEGADGSINQWNSIYLKSYPAGTFRLKQADNAGRNMYGVVVVSIVPPGAPTNLVAVSGDGKVTLNWSGGAGAAAFLVKRSENPGGPYTIIATNTTSGFVDTNVVNDSSYYYVVSAINNAGESANSNEALGTPKAAPANVVAVGGSGQVMITWDPFPGASSYTVKRSDVSGGPYATVASGIAGTSHTDSMQLLGGRNYYYVVVAQLSGGGESGQSSEAVGLTAPGAPTGVTVSLFAASVLQVRWTSTDPVVTEFRIEESTDGMNFTEIATVSGTVRSYLVGNLFPNETLHYRVRAANATGFSPYSTAATGMTPSGGININFAAGTGNSAGDPVAPVPAGYLQDIGEQFGDRGNGYSYGWDRSIIADGRYRRSANAPDLRYDTLMHLIKATPPAVWNISIPNGFYQVRIVGGDPGNVDSVFQYDVEGVLTPTVIPAGPGSVFNNWADFTVTCIVGDGQLTVASGPNSQTTANNNKICFLDIYPAVAAPMTIGTGPQDQTVEQNRSVTLSVSLSAGSQPFFYQWYRNDVEVPNSGRYTGDSFNSLTLPRPQPGDSGSYYVVITNYAGSVTSTPALLTVTPDVTPPVLLSATSLDGRAVDLCFSEELDDSMGTVSDTFSYTITNLAGSVGIGTVTFRPDRKSVRLQLSSGVAISGSFWTTVQFITDLAGLSFEPAGATVSNSVAGYFAGDVGGPGLPGTHFSCDGENIEIIGGGTDVWGNSDQFYLISKEVSGDFDAKVQVASLRGANAITKGVLTARETTNADSRALTVTLNPPPPGRNQVEAGLRATAGGPTVAVGSAFIPAGIPNGWMRITRQGDLFSAYRGTNGVDWVLLGSTTQIFPPGMVVGIGVTAHDNTMVATGSFSNFRVTGLVAAPTLINLSYSAGVFSGAFVTQNGVPYTVRYKDALDAPMWTTLTSLVGDGTLRTFTDPGPVSPTGARFYQVTSP